MRPEWGTGIGKIKSLEPNTKFEEISNFFMVTFKRKSQEYGLKKGSNEPLNEPLNKEEIIFNFIKKHPSSKRSEIVKGTGIPLGTLKRHLQKLIDTDNIIKSGSDKTGGYIVRNNNSKIIERD